MPGQPENARPGAPLPRPDRAARRQVLNGVSVSSGVAVGRSQFINRRGNTTLSRRSITAAAAEAEVERFNQALAALAAEFGEARRKLAGPADAPASGQAAGQAYGAAAVQGELLDAHIMICRDPKLMAAVHANIRERLLGAEWACDHAVQEFTATFMSMDSPYLRERASDIQTVCGRVIRILQGEAPLGGPAAAAEPQAEEDAPRIFFAHDLTPADTLALAPEHIIALVMEMGGKTSHTGILARSLRIPCVVGCTGLEGSLQDGELVIVDGINGLVLVNPTESDLAEYRELQRQFTAYEAHTRRKSEFPAETADGVRISVYGNLETSSETGLLKAMGGEGIGLYRTEFGFLSRSRLPTEDELFNDYRRVLSELAPRPVVLRTLDAGADKMIGQRRRLEEDNPALGVRAIRYCMRHQDIFRRQLRAILRASVYGNAAIMFPMISGLEELRFAKGVLSEARQELDNEGLPYSREIRIGTMIELPSAVLMASALAAEVDFFSIGTNDLIQYSLGIDRGNKYVSYLFQALHPAIIQSIKLVADKAREAGIPVCVCGEMASDPCALPLLLGMGIDEISMTPQVIPLVKNLIRRSSVENCRALLRQVYNRPTADSVLRIVRSAAYTRYAEELPFFASMTGTNI
ncbi:MAG: phosphoenolpyruvate--protein phosphotransferase [Deltaproteobacteria bacterium]|jgi:phosphotransferase system enzyme I (PtsI)|nr:phosphoenolpyruvate--protein phosphotransferase [Deltaproteobacteria bacterium]